MSCLVLRPAAATTLESQVSPARMGISRPASPAWVMIQRADSVETGLTITLIVAVILALMFTVILALFHMKKIKPPIVLQEELKAEKGYLSTSDLEYLVGKEGIAATDLRPVGKCDIDGIIFDVRSEGKYIAKGQKVRIIRIQGNTLIIKEK